ncbi:MAG: family F420-dependent class oxidoreductase [Caulobacter sp.]|nr:family F420-dependent class oxidoreductase [Caulobacter sp.]
MATAKPKLAVFLSHVDHLIDGDNARLVEMGAIAEQAGADQIVLSEHVALAQVIEGKGEASKFPFQADENYPEPLITLAAIAGATSSIRLATGILIAPLRPAIVLAKMAATLDHVSKGRLDLGFGSGWHEPELRAAGVDPDLALQVLENNLLACRALWAGGPASFSSSTLSFERLVCRPTPLSGANLPVWLAGPPTDKGADRVARLGQGWLPFGNLTADDIARGIGHLRAAEQNRGLAEGSLGVRAALPTIAAANIDAMLDAAFATAPAYVAAGAGILQLPVWRYAKTFDEVGPIIAGARARIDAL